MRNGLWRIWGSVCIAAVLVSPAVHAASFRYMALDHLVEHSKSVIQCRVVDVESSYKATANGDKIYTRYLLQVEDQWLAKASGDKSGYFSLWVQGGEIAGTAQRVLGYPKLQLNQRYVLFIENPASGLPLTGGAQGVYRFMQAKADGDALQSLTTPHHHLSAQVLKAQVQAAEVAQ